MTNFMNENLESKYPVFSDEIVRRCEQNHDFRPILFEWYKYVGILCSTISSISPESPAFNSIPPVHYGVLVGLLNRCSRLMLANVRLSSTGRYGETTSLLDRSISETAIKIQWLCYKNSHESFVRYLADGLKKDFFLRKEIEQNIQNRDSKMLVIERRMLNSIQRCIHSSKLEEQEIIDAKKLPDLASMMNNLGFSSLLYTSIQRMGSHAVHGTWSELFYNYLNYDDSQRFSPRDHDSDTQDAQFIVIIHLVLSAMEAFVKYVIMDGLERDEILSTIQEIDEEIIKIQQLAWDTIFEEIE